MAAISCRYLSLTCTATPINQQDSNSATLPTKIILPNKKPRKWSTGVAPGDYGGPPTTKLRKYRAPVLLRETTADHPPPSSSFFISQTYFDFIAGVGKSCLTLRFCDGAFTTSFIHTIGIDFKIKNVELDGKHVKLHIWDAAGQERFRTITTAYYKGVMGILLVYDVTDKSSFNNIRNWIHKIEQHASDNVNKILVGNKADMDESKRAVPTAKGQALANEYGIKFFETSARTNLNVERVFFSIEKDIRYRLVDTVTKAKKQQFRICPFTSSQFHNFTFSL
ncbi:ras-related protein RAB1BV-like [Bidens hawaiensis]|uniref:ras-related protein RAB1BV-like n=1 Tax=Bidens hawaiensis TaxID=980011 RepID=UPI0040492C8C